METLAVLSWGENPHITRWIGRPQGVVPTREFAWRLDRASVDTFPGTQGSDARRSDEAGVQV